MANIRENKRNGKTVFFRFTACLERDTQGKQVRRYITWTPPEGLTPSRARKAAERGNHQHSQDRKQHPHHSYHAQHLTTATAVKARDAEPTSQHRFE